MDTTSVTNTKAVEAFYRAEVERDIETWAAFWHPDAVQEVWINSEPKPIEGRDELIRLAREKFARHEHDPYAIDLQTDALADPSKILARLRISMVGQSSPKFHFWLLFHFEDNGLISKLEEIADTSFPGR